MYNGVDEFVIFPRSLLHFKQISVHKIYKLFSDEKINQMLGTNYRILSFAKLVGSSFLPAMHTELGF